MNRFRLFLSMITVLWLATAVAAYTSWQDSMNKSIIGRLIMIYDGYLSFFQTPFFAVVLVGLLAIVPLWGGHIYKHPKFSLKYKNLIVIAVGIVFITMGAYLLKYAWTGQQINNYYNELISKNTNPMAPVDEWRQEIDSRQILIQPSASNGVIYVTIGVILFLLSRTRVMR